MAVVDHIVSSSGQGVGRCGLGEAYKNIKACPIPTLDNSVLEAYWTNPGWEEHCSPIASRCTMFMPTLTTNLSSKSLLGPPPYTDDGLYFLLGCAGGCGGGSNLGTWGRGAGGRGRPMTPSRPPPPTGLNALMAPPAAAPTALAAWGGRWRWRIVWLNSSARIYNTIKRHKLMQQPYLLRLDATLTGIRNLSAWELS